MSGHVRSYIIEERTMQKTLSSRYRSAMPASGDQSSVVAQSRLDTDQRRRGHVPVRLQSALNERLLRLPLLRNAEFRKQFLHVFQKLGFIQHSQIVYFRSYCC